MDPTGPCNKLIIALYYCKVNRKQRTSVLTPELSTGQLRGSGPQDPLASYAAAYNKHVKFGLKIPNCLEKNMTENLGEDFLTYRRPI